MRLFLFVLLLVPVACASQQVKSQSPSVEQELGVHPDDPWERYNRAVFSFNDWLDSYLLRPVAVGYDAVVPDFVQTGVRNFFSNLGEVFSIVNNTLQFDMEGAGTSLMRLAINTTLGLWGLIDIATEVGIREDEEDFAQTLAVWGVPAGYYIVLPVFGPSTTRDVFKYADNLYYNEYKPVVTSYDQQIAAMALDLVQFRADLLSIEGQIRSDRYLFIRDAYLQNRAFQVNDGTIIEDDFFSDEDDAVSDDDF